MGCFLLEGGESARCSGCVLQRASPQAAGVCFGQRWGCVCLRVGPPTGLHKGAGLQPLPHLPRLTDQGPAQAVGMDPGLLGWGPALMASALMASSLELWPRPSPLLWLVLTGKTLRKCRARGRSFPPRAALGCLLFTLSLCGTGSMLTPKSWAPKSPSQHPGGRSLTASTSCMSRPRACPGHTRSWGGRALSTAWQLALYCRGFPAWTQRDALPDGPPNVAPYIPRVSTAFPYMASGLSKCSVLGLTRVPH